MLRRPGARMLSVVVLSTIFFGVYSARLWWADGDVQPSEFSSTTQRKLLGYSIMEKECEDDFDQTIGLYIYFIGILYLFLGLSIMCGNWFHHSLDKVAEVLHLPEDVAGATLVAAGSSCPELFTALISLFGPGNEMGIGAVVGSCVFSILVTVGLCGVSCGGVLLLDWRPIFRDAMFAMVGFTYLIWVFSDHIVTWAEGTAGVVLYIIYVAVMAVNEQILEIIDVITECILHLYLICTCRSPRRQRNKYDRRLRAKESTDNLEEGWRDSEPEIISWGKRKHNKQVGGGGSGDDVSSSSSLSPTTASNTQNNSNNTSNNSNNSNNNTTTKSSTQQQQGQGDDHNLFLLFPVAAESSSFVGRTLAIFYWGISNLIHYASQPYLFVFSHTIPDMHTPRSKRVYILAFLVCVMWIGAMSWLLVEISSKAGCILEIDPAVLGVTIIAMGGGIPECLITMSIAKEGKGTMVVCNSMGTVVFDTLFVLGFPWLLHAFALGHSFTVQNTDILRYIFVMCGFVVLLFGVLIYSDWKLDRRVGSALLGTYAVFIIWTAVDSFVAKRLRG
eukprot:TRINITY_DN861_c0_g1_i2.p1 TRINITY_DN861_c0_g1~~TRINITY_DN861_c0_g1_i2.p1  ORF type:complete len:559 (+),score=84.05 TRINITY_DN861_c0_g1_i2:294-1970(+)